MIKICGLRDVATVRATIEAGAQSIGFMLAPSKRQVRVETILDLLTQVDMGRTRSVGVVVNESADMLSSLRDRAGLDVLQLSGDERPGVLDGVPGTVWKAVRFPADTTFEQARAMVEPWFDHRHPVELVLVDAAVTGAYGGTGHRADWDLAAQLAERYPLMLAGGLNPANVGAAIEQVRPLGVDVSSGVEQSGAKDTALIERFVDQARSAFDRLGTIDGAVGQFSSGLSR